MNSLDERLEELTQTVNRADLHYTIWWIYKHDRPRALNEYLGFFRASLGAHFVAMVLELSKLADRSKQSLSFDSWIREAAASDLDRETADSLSEAVAELGPMWKKVKLLRDNLFAHRNSRRFYEELLAEAAITPDEIRGLIERSFALLNKARESRSMEKWHRDSRTGEDTRRLLADLLSHVPPMPGEGALSRLERE